MSLSFLAKKTWHTQRTDNVEQVWLAEQKKEKEEKKLKELQKQIDEERQIEELRTLQKDAGLVTDPKQKLEWMYEGPGSAVASEAQAREWMHQVDKDGDGNIQIDEFLMLMERLGKNMGKPLPSEVSDDMQMLRRSVEEMKATTEAHATAEAAELGPAAPTEPNKQKNAGITLESMMCM